MAQDASDGEDWRRRRREAADAHAAAAERARRRDVAQARELLGGFVAEVRRRGIDPQPLQATAQGRRYRTGLTGWYLRRDGSLGVGEDGAYYVLGVQPSLAARLRGVHLEPADPPLQVGRGARDGEAIDLQDLIARRLDDLGDLDA
ncbi:hypothetical protein GTR02_10830 [Kineococcus sp. R8]|uniref:hypothetical protein n=1 Tax=Kineococcus siccus TaxID=2696567 RepID=UPI0014132EDD|nr:hypothetical protein [Kineococcus siccus]NAZ82312.1 hypothetical protein [Kineococcus siccus]